ncbi:TniQ family protein [Microvirga aerilata]|uniref:TniQ family protein n=1 Tax=Microvirga aerilata TaxID=670292 RepID=A0A936Z7H7_9HYPH|nr:TniQ family protein [Microvirga aerilata]MBL0405303.1 TniQ family protein [Microvirga aerilata]
MTPLHPSLTVRLRLDETPQSQCSRNALLLGRSAREFCRDMGLSFQGIVDGDMPALEALALRTRADLGLLAAGAVVKVGECRFSVSGQALVRDTLSRKSLRVCPHCIQTDLEQGTEPLAVRPYGRTAWLIEPIRTCPEHGVGLVAVAGDDHPQRVHDFAALIQPAIPGIRQIADGASRRSVTAFERHLLARCEGSDTDDVPFLRALPFYAAAKACEVIGAIATHGIRFRTDRLSDGEWHEAGAAGFEIASGGEDAIRAFLSGLQDRVRSAKGDWGPRLVFGRLYEWLAHESDDAAYEPLRDLIRRHVVETMPLGPGDDVFGREVTVRCLHSVGSAARETGAHPKRLRKLLHAAGYVSSEAMSLSDSWVTFDAESARDFLEWVSEAMTLTEAGEYLNAPRPHERLLFEAGFIVPFVRGGTDILKDHAFAQQDLHAFLKRLLADAPDAGPDDGALVPIPSAAKRASCSAMEIVRLILDRKLARVRRRADVAGYLSVLVDPEEVKPLVQGQADGSLSLREVEQRLVTTTRVVKALIKHGHLPSRVEINPVNRCSRQVVRQDDLEAFMDRYVTLHVAAKERGIHFRKLRSALDEAGARSAFDPALVHASFYDRKYITGLSN